LRAKYLEKYADKHEKTAANPRHAEYPRDWCNEKLKHEKTNLSVFSIAVLLALPVIQKEHFGKVKYLPVSKQCIKTTRITFPYVCCKSAR
jgi:hypothetical protein